MRTIKPAHHLARSGAWPQDRHVVGFPSMPSIQKRWLMLAVLFLARTTMALQFQTVASTGPLLRDALSIDFAALGTLIGLYMLPGVVIALPGGMVGQRFGAKRVVLAGLVLMALGGAIMAVGSS